MLQIHKLNKTCQGNHYSHYTKPGYTDNLKSSQKQDCQLSAAEDVEAGGSQIQGLSQNLSQNLKSFFLRDDWKEGMMLNASLAFARTCF